MGVLQAPTPKEDRIIILDILRGFALLGILLVNIMSFSGIWSGGQEWDGYANLTVDAIIQFFFRGKFLALFAMLFGVGFALQSRRYEATPNLFLPIYGRRMLVLFLIGLAHMTLDPLEILGVYALCGLTLLFFRGIQSKYLLLWTFLLMSLPYLHTAVISTWTSGEAVTQASPESANNEKPVIQNVSNMVIEEEEETDADYGWNPYQGERAIEVYSEGSFKEVLTYNTRFSINRWTSSWVSYLWMSVPLPLMLIGFVIGRKNVFTNITNTIPRVRSLFWSSLLTGIALTWSAEFLFEWATIGGWDAWLWFAGSLAWVLGSWLLALGYATGITILFQKTLWKQFFKPLRAVGRLTLSNYLLQTGICILLFYSFGLDLYGKVGPAKVILLALGIYTIQVLLSIWWSGRFRFGPVEWLWRSLSYMRIQSICLRHVEEH